MSRIIIISLLALVLPYSRWSLLVQRETLPLSLRKHPKARCLASTLATTRSQVNEECRSQIEGNESKVRRCQRAPGENLVPDQTILGHTLPSHLILNRPYPLCLLQCYCFLLSADSRGNASAYFCNREVCEFRQSM